MTNPRRTSSPLVLALGTDVITLIKAAPAPGGARVEARWEADTPPGAFQAGAVQDPARLTAAFRALWRKAGVRERSVCVVLPPATYSMRSLRLPDLPQAERRLVVRGELEQNGALPFGGGTFDFIWMGAGRGEAADAYAYYVPDAAVAPLAEALDEAGLKLEQVEPASLAIVRAYLSTLSSPRSLAVLCPTERYTDLCIHDGHEIRLLRRIPAGYADIHAVEGNRGAQRIQEAYLGGPEEEAPVRPTLEAPVPQAVWGEQEGVVGFSPAPAPPEAPPVPRAAPVPESVVAPRERSIIEEEVARSLAFYAREHQDRPFPVALVVLGEGQTVRLFEQLLAETAPVPVTGVDLLRELNLPPPGLTAHHLQNAELLLAAVGSAVGQASGALGVPQLHVGQGESQAGLRKRERRRLVYVGLSGAAIFLAIAAGCAATLTIMEMDQQGRKTQLEAQIKQLQAERAPILRYHEVSGAAYRARNATQIAVGSVLGRVAQAKNDGITLKTLTLSADGRLTLEGRASATAKLEQFGRDLASGATVRLPVIESLRRNPEGSIDFRVTALAGKPPAPAQTEKGAGS